MFRIAPPIGEDDSVPDSISVLHLAITGLVVAMVLLVLGTAIKMRGSFRRSNSLTSGESLEPKDPLNNSMGSLHLQNSTNIDVSAFKQLLKKGKIPLRDEFTLLLDNDRAKNFICQSRSIAQTSMNIKFNRYARQFRQYLSVSLISR